MSVPTLQIVKFETRYRPDPTDGSKVVADDWVWVSPVGGQDRTCVPHRVRNIVDRLRPLASNDPASVLAHMRGDIVRRAYQMWKSGQELPEEGTPLGAWNALTPEQAEVLRTKGFKTIEAVSVMTDAHIQQVPLPMRDIIKQAKAYLAAAETNRVAHALEHKDRQIETLSDEVRDGREQITDLIKKVNALADMVAAQQSTDAKAKKAKVA